MFKITVYIETPEGKIEKVTESFDTLDARNDCLMKLLLSSNFHYLMVNGEPFAAF